MDLKHNREAQCYPLLRFREGMQSLGLLRKHKGALLLTKADVAAQRDPDRLWGHMAGRLIPKSDEKLDAQATMLMLAFAAASAGSKLRFDKMTALLAELGWRYSDGRSISESSLRQLPVYEVLTNVTDQPVTRARRNVVSLRQQHWRAGRSAETESFSRAEEDPEIVRHRLHQARRAAQGQADTH